MKDKKTGLGRGLEALFDDNSLDIEQDSNRIQMVPLSEVEPNREQPRKYFKEEIITELSESIKQVGLLEPILVRKLDNGTYQIISGERRWRACRLAGMAEIPVIVKEYTDKEALEIGLIENLQREDLNEVEEAKGYKLLSDRFGMTQEEISERVGKSRSSIANKLRILRLPEKILEMVLSGRITEGHARALLPILDKFGEERTLEIAQSIPEKELTVRDIERMASQTSEKKPKEKDIYFREVEETMSRNLGRKVSITPGKKGKGKIEIEFYSTEDFNEFTERFCK